MAKRETSIALIRHPETTANLEGRYVGRLDAPLTELGKAQVASIAIMMRAWAPGLVLTSPRKRALVTAKRITACGTPMQVLEDLGEIDFGRAEGLTWAELTAMGMTVQYPASVPGSPARRDDAGGPSAAPVAPGGERWDDFRARVVRAASTAEGTASRVAIVTHGGVFRVLLTHWLGLPPDAAWRFSVPCACVATLTVRDGAGVLISVIPPE